MRGLLHRNPDGMHVPDGLVQERELQRRHRNTCGELLERFVSRGDDRILRPICMQRFGLRHGLREYRELHWGEHNLQ
jgi:hypothetical protein